MEKRGVKTGITEVRKAVYNDNSNIVGINNDESKEFTTKLMKRMCTGITIT